VKKAELWLKEEALKFGYQKAHQLKVGLIVFNHSLLIKIALIIFIYLYFVES
jgi:hypothetical protein